MDLRVGDLRAAKAMQSEPVDHAGALDDRPAWDLRLRIGSHIAAEARAAVKVGPHLSPCSPACLLNSHAPRQGVTVAARSQHNIKLPVSHNTLLMECSLPITL